MACTFDDLAQIINTVENLLFMSNPQLFIKISTGYNKRQYSNNQDREILFTKINFFLKNSESEIILSNNFGVLFYLDSNGNSLTKIPFKYDNISMINSEFQKGLREILAFDEKHINLAQSAKNFEKVEIADEQLETAKSSLDEIRKTIPE